MGAHSMNSSTLCTIRFCARVISQLYPWDLLHGINVACSFIWLPVEYKHEIQCYP